MGKYRLGPIPNSKEPHDNPRFYVARKTHNTYVAIVPHDGFSYTGSLKDAEVSAWWISQDGCQWPVDAIVEVLNRADGSSFIDSCWNIHEARVPVDYQGVPPLGYAPPYEDFGSW